MTTRSQIILFVAVPILVAIAVWRLVGDVSVTNLPLAITFGFFAGLILNITPCVLPVVGIKIHALMRQADQDSSRTFRLGIAFALGMLLVFVILGLLAAYAKLGWGQAFQSDTFLVILSVILVTLALETFGVYTIQLPGFVSRSADSVERAEGLTGSFAKGMLATVLATPCGAPLLGATLSYALRQSPSVTLIVFVSVGFGMACPYLMLSWKPQWLSLLPRSGPWMQVFREVTGFLILGTAVWLLWQRRFDGEFVVRTVVLCLLVSFAAWLYGRLSSPTSSSKHRFMAPFAAGWTLVASVAFVHFFMSGATTDHSVEVANTPPTMKADSELQPAEDDEWRPYRREVLDDCLKEGQSVMVMWTADW